MAPVFIDQPLGPVQIRSELSQHVRFGFHGHGRFSVLGVPCVDTAAWTGVGSGDDAKAITS